MFFGKPVSTPDQVRGYTFSGHALAAEQQAVPAPRPKHAWVIKKNPKQITRLGFSGCCLNFRLIWPGGGVSGDGEPPGRPLMFNTYARGCAPQRRSRFSVWLCGKMRSNNAATTHVAKHWRANVITRVDARTAVQQSDFHMRAATGSFSFRAKRKSLSLQGLRLMQQFYFISSISPSVRSVQISIKLIAV